LDPLTTPTGKPGPNPGTKDSPDHQLIQVTYISVIVPWSAHCMPAIR
jgi:hypothetical protein